MTIFVGQAGVQVANCFWELLCAEHAITNEGLIQETDQEMENKLSFFQVIQNDRCLPRSLIVDLEPTVIGIVL